MVEIRWHGRGGQGAKTASQLLALTQLAVGASVQAFPEYGPERSGAPMQTFNRADRYPIRRHDGVRTPDYVVVLDDSLLAERGVTEGLDRTRLLIVNTRRAPAEVRGRLTYRGDVWCLDATGLAQRAGSKYANVVLLGALAAALGDLPVEVLENACREEMQGRLGREALAATLRALAEGYAWAERRRVG